MNLRYIQLSPTYIIALQKIMQAISGLSIALVVINFLSPHDQGYYYAIGSLLSSYIIFDLGVSNYLLQKSAQLSTSLKIDNTGNITPNGPNKEDFIAFTYWTLKWYKIVSVVTFTVLAPIGIFILQQKSLTQTNWLAPWLVVVIAAAINMPTLAMFAIFEGFGLISSVYKLRILHSALGAILACVAITTGYGLYAQALPLLATTAVCYIYFYSKFLRFNKPNQCINNVTKLSITGQIRFTSITLTNNYLFLNAPVIIVFANGDIESAGKLGLTSIICNVCAAFSLSSTTAKLPEITKLIFENKIVRAQRIFEISILKYLAIYFTLGLGLVIAGLSINNLDIFARTLTGLDLILILTSFAIFNLSNYFILFLKACELNRAIYYNCASFTVIPLALTHSGLEVTTAILAVFLSILPAFFASGFYYLQLRTQRNTM